MPTRLSKRWIRRSPCLNKIPHTYKKPVQTSRQMPISLFSCNFHFTPRAAYRPLRGLWFFTGTPTAFISYDREVSVPLRDYGSSLFVSYLNFISIVKFPSPYGIMVLHSTPYQWLNYAIENGVCGADFIFRLFFCFFAENFLSKILKGRRFITSGRNGIKLMKYVYIIPYFWSSLSNIENTFLHRQWKDCYDAVIRRIEYD